MNTGLSFEQMQDDVEVARRLLTANWSMSHPEEATLLSILYRWEQAGMLNGVNIYVDSNDLILSTMNSVLCNAENEVDAQRMVAA